MFGQLYKSMICAYCEKQISNKFNFARHIMTCKKKEIVELRLELERQRLHYERLLQQVQDEHERNLLQVEKQHQQDLQRETEKYDILKALADKLHNQLFEIAKQPNTVHHTTTTTTTQTNMRMIHVVNQLGVYEFDEKRMEQLLEENFTQDVFLGGPDKIAEMAAQYLLTDLETQKPKVMCTDVSRKMYRYVDPETQELQTDPGFQKTHRLIKRPLEQANLRVFYDHFLRNDPDDYHRDQWKKNDEFIEHQHKFPEKLHPFLRK